MVPSYRHTEKLVISLHKFILVWLRNKHFFWICISCSNPLLEPTSTNQWGLLLAHCKNWRLLNSPLTKLQVRCSHCHLVICRLNVIQWSQSSRQILCLTIYQLTSINVTLQYWCWIDALFSNNGMVLLSNV